MSEELRKELKQIEKEIVKIRKEYRESLSTGTNNKQLYYKIIELEAQSQVVIKLMRKYYFVK